MKLNTLLIGGMQDKLGFWSMLNVYNESGSGDGRFVIWFWLQSRTVRPGGKEGRLVNLLVLHSNSCNVAGSAGRLLNWLVWHHIVCKVAGSVAGKLVKSLLEQSRV